MMLGCNFSNIYFAQIKLHKPHYQLRDPNKLTINENTLALISSQNTRPNHSEIFNLPSALLVFYCLINISQKYLGMV